MKEFYFAKKTHFFWPPREQQIISNNTLQGTESYTCLLQALGQTHPWSNSTDANGGSSIANLKRSKVTSQAGKKKPNKKISKIKRLQKSQKEKAGFGVDLPSGFWALRVTCLWVFATASWETQVWLHAKAEIPTSAHTVGSWGFETSRNYRATWNKTTRVGNTELVAPLTPGELHRGWLSPTSCFKSIIRRESAQLLPMAEKYSLLHLKDGQGH